MSKALNNLATLALSRVDLDEARKHLDRAIELRPGLASAHNRLAVVHARSGDPSAAIGSWKRAAIDLDPQHFDALYNLSMALFDLAPREALPYLERFVREAPRER